MFETITFHRHSPAGPGPWFDARSVYVERVWTAALGPSSILLLRAAATILDAGEPLSLDGEDVAGSLGLGHHGGRRSSLCHTLERLQLFGLAGLNDPDVTVQTVLSPMSARRLAQTPSSVQQAHHSLLRAHTATASRLEPTSR